MDRAVDEEFFLQFVAWEQLKQPQAQGDVFVESVLDCNYKLRNDGFLRGPYSHREEETDHKPKSFELWITLASLQIESWIGIFLEILVFSNWRVFKNVKGFSNETLAKDSLAQPELLVFS